MIYSWVPSWGKHDGKKQVAIHCCRIDTSTLLISRYGLSGKFRTAFPGELQLSTSISCVGMAFLNVSAQLG